MLCLVIVYWYNIRQGTTYTQTSQYFSGLKRYPDLTHHRFIFDQTRVGSTSGSGPVIVFGKPVHLTEKNQPGHFGTRRMLGHRVAQSHITIWKFDAKGELVYPCYRITNQGKILKSNSSILFDVCEEAQEIQVTQIPDPELRLATERESKIAQLTGWLSH
ncbi:MAG: hypothetical protein SFX18_19330 [Pirellulales bacterium]|nr:hypothetical protein [Pirellulales bacterium]